ncbi:MULTISPECIES: TraB/GumN family protein [unclassified Marinovum]
MRVRAVFLTAALALLGGGASAQSWASRAVCDVPEVGVHDAVFAPTTLAALEQAAAKIPNAKGRFWRVTAPSGAVSHVWGTMHSADPRILDLPDMVQQRIADARVVAIEIDPTFPDRAAFDAQFDTSDWLRNGRQDSALTDTALPPHVLAWIRLRTQAIGWGHDAPERLTPGGLAELLLSDPCSDFTAGVLPVQDGRIQMLALIAGAKIHAFERPDRIRRHLDHPGNAGFAVDFLSVYGSYLDPETTWQDRATQMALYLRGELGVMMAWDRAYVSDTLADDGAIIDRVNAYLLDARNHAFTSNIRSEMAQGGVLLAVGAFHLPGQSGLIALLRAQGHTVTRIPIQGEARP